MKTKNTTETSNGLQVTKSSSLQVIKNEFADKLKMELIEKIAQRDALNIEISHYNAVIEAVEGSSFTEVKWKDQTHSKRRVRKWEKKIKIGSGSDIFLKALDDLGGRATVSEIIDHVSSFGTKEINQRIKDDTLKQWINVSGQSLYKTELVDKEKRGDRKGGVVYVFKSEIEEEDSKKKRK